MGTLFGEPVLLLVAGGGALVQAFMQLLVVFGVPLTGPQQAAITTFAGLVIGLITRSQVAPVPTPSDLGAVSPKKLAAWAVGIALAAGSMTGCAAIAGKLGLTSVQQQVSTADGIAYASLSAFDVVEEAQWKAKAPWPTAAQHQAISQALITGYQDVIDVARADLALLPGQTLAANIQSELTALTTIADQLVTQTPPTAPPAAVAKAAKARADTVAFVAKARAHTAAK